MAALCRHTPGVPPSPATFLGWWDLRWPCYQGEPAEKALSHQGP